MFSLNAGIFASVLLASRLPSDVYVFAFLCLATELLVCFPLLRQSIILVRACVRVCCATLVNLDVEKANPSVGRERDFYVFFVL